MELEKKIETLREIIGKYSSMLEQRSRWRRSLSELETIKEEVKVDGRLFMVRETMSKMNYCDTVEVEELIYFLCKIENHRKKMLKLVEQEIIESQVMLEN